MEKMIYHAPDDPQFQNPNIDVECMKLHRMPDGTEIEYLYIHGSFEGTSVRFSYHIPVRDSFEGRFFQHLSPFPGPDEEMASMEKQKEDDVIGFALSHGACFVESNMGSTAIFSSDPDSTIYYRSSAATAEFLKTTLKRLYGCERTFGYVFGGSGGGYKTMSCIENTDAWDGALAYVIGSPMSLPNCLTVAAHGCRILRNAYPRIVDALEPGGCGDIYEGLEEEETEALKEITKIGFPPKMCYTFASDDDGSLPVLAPDVHRMDPEYFTDFWTKSGYLGTKENSSAVRDRIKMKTIVVSVGFIGKDGAQNVKMDTALADDRNGVDTAWKKLLADGSSVYLELKDVPEGENLYLRGLTMELLTGKAAGQKMLLGKLEGKKAILGMCFGMTDLEEVVKSVKTGDEITLDNSDYIAIQTYHRHQVPRDRSFTAWDQYRDADGNPIYPQRKEIISYKMTGSSGSIQDGQIQGKVMVMNNLMDGDFPWQADWYRRKVEQAHGKDASDCFRIYYNDNCPHGDQTGTADELRATCYLGMLHQALLDLSSWVEKGVLPPENTGYRIEDGQVYLEKEIQKRNGYQPDISVKANGKESIYIKVGETVNFEAVVQTPKKGGSVLAVEWSFEGEFDFPEKDVCPRKRKQDAGMETAISCRQHTFWKPGTYFVVAKAVAGREKDDYFTRLRNIGRVRVVAEI